MVVLGKAKVISYKDLKQARAKRSAKEKATAAKGKGQCGRKRKSPTGAERNSQEEEAGSLVPKNKMARRGEVEPTGALWRA